MLNASKQEQKINEVRDTAKKGGEASRRESGPKNTARLIREHLPKANGYETKQKW